MPDPATPSPQSNAIHEQLREARRRREAEESRIREHIAGRDRLAESVFKYQAERRAARPSEMAIALAEIPKALKALDRLKASNPPYGLDKLDLDETFNNYFSGFDRAFAWTRGNERDQARPIAAAAMELLRGMLSETRSIEEVTQALCESELDEVRWWFDILLQMVAGMNRFLEKPAPGSPATAERSREAGDAGQFIERLLAGPDDVELSGREMALLEAHLQQPISISAIQREKQPTGHSQTQANRNKLTLIRDFNRRLQRLQVPTDGPENLAEAAPAYPLAESADPANPTDEATILLMRVFTNGLSDDRIKEACRVLTDDRLTVNEKLTKIDALIRFPATASAEQLGELLGVSKQAVLKTAWWIQNRKGEKENEIGRRRAGYQKRAKEYEWTDSKKDGD